MPQALSVRMDPPTVEFVKAVTEADRQRDARRNAVSLISPMPPPGASRKRSADDYSTPRGKRQRPARTHNGASIATSPDYYAMPRRVFGQGMYTNVYRGTYSDHASPHHGEECVLKVFKTGDVFEADYFDADVSTTQRARTIVSAFNSVDNYASGKSVYMNEAAVWQDINPRPDGTRARMLVEPLIEGEFIKFNSNSGHSNGDKLMGALSHFSYHHTAGEELLCDLQGGRYEDCYVLTDPVMMSLDRKYGPTDLGERGVSNFFAHHRCSELCHPSWRKFLLPAATIAVREGSTMEPVDQVAQLQRAVRPTQQQAARGAAPQAQTRVRGAGCQGSVIAGGSRGTVADSAACGRARGRAAS